MAKIAIGMIKNKNVKMNMMIMIAIREFMEIYHTKIVKNSYLNVQLEKFKRPANLYQSIATIY